MDKSIIRKMKITNVNGDNVIEIEIIPSKKGNWPSFSQLDFSGDVKLELFGEDAFEEYKGTDVIKVIDQMVEGGVFAKDEKVYKNPKVTYEDVTEKLILGSKPIKMESLKSQEHGLWAMSGIRKFEISFDNVDCFFKDGINETNIRIVFTTVNGKKCDYREFVTDFTILKENRAIVNLDTNMFGDAFVGEMQDRKRLKLDGYIEIVCVLGKGKEILYKYPIELYVINTEESICDCISDLPASIDFGTSSTCVAIERNNRNELLTLSPMVEEDDESEGNVYENPTNIMIYDWDELYSEWKAENDCAPIVNKGTKQEYLKTTRESDKCHAPVNFDSGYTVKSILGSDDTDRKELNAILTLIKMIPYQIMEEKMQIDLNPYNDKNKFIDIVCGIEEQSDSAFNPVAFYGYLIGRAINDISKHEDIYTQFQITSPVMFNDDVKEALKKSLEFGLRRSVPKNLRDSVEVTITHTEPVAYIGAMCGTEYFQVEEDEEKMFAVFDFGGGTLDFSYGIVSNEDELKIEVIKVGGKDNFGGETLIERIAYRIWCDNKKLIDANIPFVQPYGEDLPDGIDERLVKKSDYAKANMNIISAKIARNIFEGKIKAGESSKKMELFDHDGNREEYQVNYDIEVLEAELKDLIIQKVEEFATTLNDAFSSRVDNFQTKDVYIFKAGNSSRSKYVDEGMKKYFPDSDEEHIQLVDQSTDKKKAKRYSITPKTAVAIGQLKLNRIEVVGDNNFFNYYVGFFNEGTGKFKTVLDRSHGDGSWHKFRKVKNDIVDIQFATSKPSDNSTVSRKQVKNLAEYKGMDMYIRIKDETTIEYCFGDYTDVSEIEAEVTTIELDLR